MPILFSSLSSPFPNYYDNAAKADELWGGAARMYPWNETRLRVAQFDDNGATGKYYAIYFSGLTQATDGAGNPASGAGNNINGFNYFIHTIIKPFFKHVPTISL